MANLIKEAKLMQLRAGLITEDEFTTEDAPAVPTKGEERVVKDLPTLKLYFKDLATNQIPVALDPKESVELYNFIKQYIQKGSKGSLSGIAKTTNANFARTTKGMKV